MSNDPKERFLVHRRPVHAGPIVDLSVDTVRFPDGSTGDLEIVRHSGASAVVPLIESDGRLDVVLVRQFRYAAGGELLEIPAGRPDYPGEPWEVCARRELEEETGYRASGLSRLGKIFTTPGFTDEAIRLYLGTDLVPGRTSKDEDEFIAVERIPFSEVLGLIARGEISDAKTICALHLAAVRLGEDPVGPAVS